MESLERRDTFSAPDLPGLPAGSVDVADYFAVLRRRKWLILAVIAACAGIAAFSTLRTVPLYRSSAVVLLNPISPTAVNAMQRSVLRPDQLIYPATEQLLAESEAVHDRAADIVRSRGYDPDILSGVAVLPSADVQMMTLQHVATTPEAAQQGARAYAEAYLQYRRERAVAAAAEQQLAVARQVGELQELLEEADQEVADATPNTAEYQSAQSQRSILTNQIASLQSSMAGVGTDALSAGELLGEPQLPTAPFSPQNGRTIAAGLLVGGVLGVVAAFTRDRFDDRVRSERDVLQAGGLPVVGSLPRSPWPFRRRTAGLITVREPDGESAESYRRLRSWLLSLPEDRAPRVLLVTSARPAEGKTTVACNLAVCLAEAGRRVAIVSADLRNPGAHALFPMENGDGLSEVLAGRMTLKKALRSVPPAPGLSLLSSGHGVHRPTTLLASAKMRDTVAALSRTFDYVVIDTAPVLSVADSLAMSAYVDGVLMVVRGRVTPATMLDHARAQLTAVGATILGAVVWNIAESRDDPYLYGQPTRGARARLWIQSAPRRLRRAVARSRKK